MRLLASLFGNLARIEETATESHATAAFLEAIEMSHGDLNRLLATALRAEYSGERTYVWCRDVFDAYVVYEVEAEEQTSLYQRSYTIADGVVTLGDPMRVVAVTQYVPAEQTPPSPPAVQVTQVSQPAEEAAEELTGELVPLVEKAVKKDGTAEIKIIAPGQGSSGYYPAEVLQRDGPKVFTEKTQIYLDHPSVSDERERPERSVRDLAGSLTGPAVWREDGLYAPVKFIDSVAPHINAIAAISGMSIRAAGKAGTREVDGKKVRSIESIDVAHSVDVVTKPGAGGKVMDLIESARNGRSVDPPGEDGMDKEKFEEAQRELAELKQWKADQEAREAAAKLLGEARTLVVETLKPIAMPDMVRDRLTESLSANPPVKDGALDREALATKVTEAATAELDYLAKATGNGGRIRGMGATEPTTSETPKLEESTKRIEEALAAF